MLTKCNLHTQNYTEVVQIGLFKVFKYMTKKNWPQKMKEILKNIWD